MTSVHDDPTLPSTESSGAGSDVSPPAATVSRTPVITIGLLAWILFVVLHEIVGHAGIAAVLGEDVRGLASTTAHIHDFYEIDHVAARIGAWGFRLVCAGGLLLNLITAAVALGLLASGRIKSSGFGYFLWFFAAVSIVQQSFWMMLQPIMGLGGDWVALLNDLEPRLLWRIMISVLGLILFVAGIRLPLRWWNPVLPADPAGRKRCLHRMILLPLGVAFVVQFASVLVIPLSWARWAVVITVATFLPLVIWALIAIRPRWWQATAEGEAPLRITVHPAWVVLAVILTLLFVGWLGPGIGSFEGHPQYGG